MTAWADSGSTPLTSSNTTANLPLSYGFDQSDSSVVITGTWNGATATVETYSVKGATWVTTGAALTANGILVVSCKSRGGLRINVTGAGGSTNLVWEAA